MTQYIHGGGKEYLEEAAVFWPRSTFPHFDIPTAGRLYRKDAPWERSEALVLEPTGREDKPRASVPTRDIACIDHILSIRRQKQAERESAWLK